MKNHSFQCSLAKGRAKYNMNQRKICPCCGIRPVAVNYYKGEVAHYRTKCDQCHRARRKPLPAGWIRSGYKKMDHCERCSFRFKTDQQASVHHIDGNDYNNDWSNLKTICANCSIELAQSGAKWQHNTGGGHRRILPDF